MSAPFYVVQTSAAPWVLRLEGFTAKADAERAVRWQGEHSGPWAICKIKGGDLVSVFSGAAYPVRRGPYTSASWDKFKAESGYLEPPLEAEA